MAGITSPVTNGALAGASPAMFALADGAIAYLGDSDVTVNEAIAALTVFADVEVIAGGVTVTASISSGMAYVPDQVEIIDGNVTVSIETKGWTEDVPDPGFDNPSAWTIAGTGGAITGSQLVFTNAFCPSVIPSAPINAVVGRQYDYVLDVANAHSGTLGKINFAGNTLWDSSLGHGPGIFADSVVALTTAPITVQSINVGIWRINGVSIRNPVDRIERSRVIQQDQTNTFLISGIMNYLQAGQEIIDGDVTVSIAVNGATVVKKNIAGSVNLNVAVASVMQAVLDRIVGIAPSAPVIVTGQIVASGTIPPSGGLSPTSLPADNGHIGAT